MRRIALLFLPVFVFILSFFLDKKYLCGRHFNNNFTGVRWGFRTVLCRNILRLAPKISMPIGLNCTVSSLDNLIFDVDDLNNFQSPGTYYQNFKAKIYLGKGCYIAPNVGIITANHNLHDLDSHSIGEDVVIGEQCWIGMNSVVLPGVKLGNNTIVAAGSVVTKSFVEGSVIIGGVPAKIIRTLSSGS